MATEKESMLPKGADVLITWSEPTLRTEKEHEALKFFGFDPKQALDKQSVLRSVRQQLVSFHPDRCSDKALSDQAMAAFYCLKEMGPIKGPAGTSILDEIDTLSPEELVALQKTLRETNAYIDRVTKEIEKENAERDARWAGWHAEQAEWEARWAESAIRDAEWEAERAEWEAKRARWREEYRIAKEQRDSAHVDAVASAFLPEKLFLLRQRLWAWIWDSKEGQGLIAELTAWRLKKLIAAKKQELSQHTPSDRAIILNAPEVLEELEEQAEICNDTQLSGALEEYLEDFQEQHGSNFWLRWFYQLINKISTIKQMRQALRVFLTIDEALEEKLFPPLRSSGNGVLSVSMLKSATQPVAASELLNFAAHKEMPSLHLQIRDLYQRSGWFSVVRHAVRGLYQEIEDYFYREAPRESASSVPSSFSSSTTVEPLKQPLENAQAALSALLFPTLANQVITPSSVEAQWDEKIKEVFLSKQCIGELGTKPIASQTLDEIEALYAQRLSFQLQHLTESHSQPSEENLRSLVSLLWEGVSLKKLIDQKKPFLSGFRTFFSSPVSNTSDQLWQTVGRLQQQLLTQVRGELLTNPSFDFLRAELSFLSNKKPLLWRENHRRALQTIYKENWPLYLKQRSQLKPSQLDEHIEFKENILATHLYKGMFVTTPEDAKAYRLMIEKHFIDLFHQLKAAQSGNYSVNRGSSSSSSDGSPNSSLSEEDAEGLEIIPLETPPRKSFP
jgi:hypothetical protein